VTQTLVLARSVNEEEEQQDEQQQQAEEEATRVFFDTPLIQLKQFQSFGDDPVIDEPITGAGNEDLWIPGDRLRPGAPPGDD